jgi:UDP-glucose 4-epimerase
MRTLVTGGAGFVGTNLVKRLLKDGHDVVSIDNYSTGKKENHQEGCNYWNFDLSDRRNAVLERDEYDVIFHLAALPRIVPSFKDPVATFTSGPVATINVLDRAKKNKIPVIYAGSSSCSGDVYANPYTFSKWQNEELCNLYSKLFDVPTTICRFYNVYGEYQTNEGAYCNVLGIFERKYRMDKPLTITGDGEQRRDFTYVGDIVDGLIRASQYKSDSLSEEFELGNGKNYSINELAEAFGNYSKVYIDARPGEMRVTLNTDTKAEDLLGWKPKGDIIKFVKENYILMK